jgi:hypothetical protein
MNIQQKVGGEFVRRLLPLAEFHFMLFVISLNGRSEPILLKNSPFASDPKISAS